MYHLQLRMYINIKTSHIKLRQDQHEFKVRILLLMNKEFGTGGGFLTKSDQDFPMHKFGQMWRGFGVTKVGLHVMCINSDQGSF